MLKIVYFILENGTSSTNNKQNNKIRVRLHKSPESYSRHNNQKAAIIHNPECIKSLDKVCLALTEKLPILSSLVREYFLKYHLFLIQQRYLSLVYFQVFFSDLSHKLFQSFPEHRVLLVFRQYCAASFPW